jgi:glucose-1-phosphate thymidylyltransferase
MKGIILAGGTGSRLYPLTKITNKALLPVGKFPMIYHILNVLISSNIKDVMIITSPEHVDHIVNYLGSGKDFDCEITYKIQDKPLGIAHALYMCKDFCGKDKSVTILGDNIFENLNDVVPEIKKFQNSKENYHLFIKQTHHPERFGVPEIVDGVIVDVVEKPKNPPSNYAVTGLYLYDHHVFDIIKNLTPSKRGEYEITDVAKQYINNFEGNYTIIENGWTDAGTFESYEEANNMMRTSKEK